MSSSNRGFTLIEVMVALALLGLIAMLLASGARLSLDISARGNSKADNMRMERTKQRLIISQLQEAVPFRYWTQEENTRIAHVAFEGEPDRIRFISRYGIVDGPDSLPRWVYLQWKATTNGTNELVVEEHRILSPDNDPGETITPQTGMLSCTGLRFEYLDTTGEKPQWLPTWTGPERKAALPFAIRFQCKTSDESLRFLIPLDYAESARQGMLLQ